MNDNGKKVGFFEIISSGDFIEEEMIQKKGSSMPFDLGHQKDWNPFLNCENLDYKKSVANFNKNKGKISPDASELEFFTFIRDKRNRF